MRDNRQHKKCPLLQISGIESFQGYSPSTGDINFVCLWLELYWAFPIRNTTLSSVWQMGTDPKDKVGSCCLRAHFPSAAKPRRTKSEVRALSEPAMADLCTQMLRQGSKYLPFGLVLLQGLLGSLLLLHRWAGFCSCPSTHSETWLMWPFTCLHPLRKWLHLFLCCEFPQD